MRRHARVLFAIAALASFFAFATSAAAEYEYAGTFASEGSGDGQLAAKPGRAALEPSTGNLFVVDTGNDRVQVFKPNGSKTADYLTQFGAGQLSDPWGIAIDQQGGQTTVYVSDAGNNRVVKYDSDEAATPSFTLDGSFGLAAGKVGDYKAALAVDPTSHDLLVADPGKILVQRFGSNGAFKSSFDGSAGKDSPGPFSALNDIAVNSGGDVYVTGQIEEVDIFTTSAHRYSAAGSYKATLAPITNGHAGLVAVNPSNDEVVVSGNQTAWEYFQSPTVHRFDSSNAPLGELTVDLFAGTFHGLAAASDRFYAMVDVAENPFGFPPSPRIDVFFDFHKPVVAVDPVSKLTATATSAKLTGTVNPNGLATEFHFEYSADGGSTWSSTPDQNLPAGTAPVAVSATASGLTPETEYLFRLAASNSEGAKISSAKSFRLTYVREVVTGSATNRTPSGTTLNGTVNPGGIELTQCAFEYGETTSYGSTTPCAESNAAIGSGEAPVPVHADVSGLVPGDYHFRLAAANAGGPTKGEDAGFSLVTAPVISDLSGSVIYPEATYTEVRLQGKIAPGNAKTTYRVEYGPTTAYGQATPDRELAKNLGEKAIFLTIAPLPKNATYHFRVVASNEAGSVNGEDLVLTLGSGRPADSCPNAAVRAAQGSTRLGECRAYEMVSPFDKAGNDVYGEQISPDGTHATIDAGGGLPGVGAQSGTSHYRSTRLGSDWSGPLSLDPPQRANGQDLRFQQVLAISEDQSRAFVFSSKALAPGAVEGGSNLYVRDLATDAYYLVASHKRLSEEYAGLNAPAFFNIEGSSDFSRIVFDSEAMLTPDAPAPDEFVVRNLYEWSFESGLEQASYLPNGTAIRGIRTYTSPKTRTFDATTSRLLYTNSWPFNQRAPGLYLREGDDVVQITASQRSGDDPDAVHSGTYLGAAKDLSIIYFVGEANLTDDSHHDLGQLSNSGPIYRYDVASGELTDLTADFGPGETNKLNSFYFTEQGEVTQDGEAIYLGSFAKLAPGGVEASGPYGKPTNIYRFTKDDIEHVVTEPSNYAIDFRYTGATSPNGRYFAYESTGHDTDDTTTGPSCEWEGTNECQQIYLYDSVEKTLACVSCDPTGGPSRGNSNLVAYSYLRSPNRNVTNQGLVGFQTPNPLDSGDVNDRTDVYTWRAGQIELISSGKGSGESYYNDMTPDGSSILFSTSQRLVGRDQDDLVDTYVAQVDGGFTAQNAVPVSPPCEGAECKGAATPAPSEPGAATANFSGQGNVKAKPKARCGKGSKRVAAKSKARCVRKKQKSKGKQRAAGKKRGGGR